MRFVTTRLTYLAPPDLYYTHRLQPVEVPLGYEGLVVTCRFEVNAIGTTAT